MSRVFELHPTKPPTSRSAPVWREGMATDYVSFGGGVQVSPANAMTLSAVYCAINAISSDIAQCPMHVYRRLPNGGKMPIYDHPLENLLNVSPNDNMTSTNFLETIIHHILGWGNGYVYVNYDVKYQPISFTILSPAMVMPKVTNKSLVYVFKSSSGKEMLLNPLDVLHFHGLGYDGISGYSPIIMMANSMAIGLSLDTMQRSFFSNGCALSMALKSPKRIGPEARQQLREDWNRLHRGPNNAHVPVVLDGDMDIVPLSIGPKEAEIIASRQFQIEEVARAFRIPVSKLMSNLRATYATLEQEDLAYIKGIMPWIKRITSEIERKLLYDESLTIKMNINSLLRVESSARISYYKSLFQMGALSINEIREAEGYNPIDQYGDMTFMQSNMATLEQIQSGSTLNAPPPPHPPEIDTKSLLRELIIRSFRVEKDKLTRHSKRNDYNNWLIQFKSEHAWQIISSLTPIIPTLSSRSQQIIDRIGTDRSEEDDVVWFSSLGE